MIIDEKEYNIKKGFEQIFGCFYLTYKGRRYKIIIIDNHNSKFKIDNYKRYEVYKFHTFFKKSSLKINVGIMVFNFNEKKEVVRVIDDYLDGKSFKVMVRR